MSEPSRSLREIADHAWMDLQLGRGSKVAGPGGDPNYEYAIVSLMVSLKIDEVEAIRLIDEVADRDAFNWYVEGRRSLLIPQE